MKERSSKGKNMNLESSRASLENCRGSGGKDLQFGARKGVYV
jgi:hypothetical protein